MPPYDGDAVYFLAQSGRRPRDNEELWKTWHRLITGHLEVRSIPGTHGSIIQYEDAQFLAQELAACIDRAMVQSGSRAEAQVSMPSADQQAAERRTA
jgi:hypothetical protein